MMCAYVSALIDKKMIMLLAVTPFSGNWQFIKYTRHIVLYNH